MSTAPQCEPPKAAPAVFQPPLPASHPVSAQAPEEVEAAATASLLAAPPEQCDGAVVGEVKGKAPKKVWDSSRYMCEHKRRKYLCRECGGSQICAHNKVRTSCKECKGGTICDHGRR